jgi:hypothetical protein
MESKPNALSSFSWADVNWDALKRLRARFLEFSTPAPTEAGAPPVRTASADYWRSHSELASYDFTFAERIGWKWDFLLAELKARGWAPPASANMLDWGCGSGVAGRRVIEAWGAEHFASLTLSDRSKAALHFAAQRARELYPKLRVSTGLSDEMPRPKLLVVSHVINELDTQALNRLVALAAAAETVLWVEPGTFQASRELVGVRERLLAQVPAFTPVAPCPHSQRCGLLAAENERHWCHHFAKAPKHVFQESGWGRFAGLVEVDLGSVPFSCLVLDRRPAHPPVKDPVSPASRVIGVPRHYKGFDKVLSCQQGAATGVPGEEGVPPIGEVFELTLQKRDAPAFSKEMKKDPGSLYQWKRNGDKIQGGVRVF